MNNLIYNMFYYAFAYTYVFLLQNSLISYSVALIFCFCMHVEKILHLEKILQNDVLSDLKLYMTFHWQLALKTIENN